MNTTGALAPTDDPLTDDSPRRPRSSISSFLFVSFTLFLLTNHNTAELIAQNEYRDALDRMGWQLGNFTQWRVGNSSNFTMPDRNEKAMDLMYHFVPPGQVLDSDAWSYYTNITGGITGDMTARNMTDLYTRPGLGTIAQDLMTDANLTQIHENAGGWNWTACDKIGWSVVEKFPPEEVDSGIAILLGRIELSSSSLGESLQLAFEGVHFISNGSVYGLASVDDPDIRALPSLVPPSHLNATAAVVEAELSHRLSKIKARVDAGLGLNGDDNEWSTDSQPRVNCTFLTHLHVVPSLLPLRTMELLESELQHPTGLGSSLPSLPELKLEGVMIAKDCGVVIDMQEGVGVRSKTWLGKLTTYAGLSSILCLGLLALLSRQISRSQTPAALSRLSRWTFLIQAVVDAVFFAGNITFAMVAEGQPSISLVAPAFMAVVLFVNEAQFALLINQVQAPEDAVETQPSPVPTAPAPTAPVAPVAGQPTTETDATQQPPAPAMTATGAAIAPARTEPRSPSFLSGFVTYIRTDAQAKLWLTLTIALTFIIRTILYPPLALLTLAITYACVWVPQIWRSARRGRRGTGSGGVGLGWEYVLGTTVGRLAIVGYFLGYRKNVLDIEPRGWLWPLGAFLLFQVLVLRLQDIFGPAFFLPKRWSSTPIYDYHPPIPLPDPEAPEQTLGDCSICMDAIYIDASQRRTRKSVSEGREESGGRVGGGLLGAVGGVAKRKEYSLAPCHHLFHTECLERWLAIKNICPQCRRPLPPL